MPAFYVQKAGILQVKSRCFLFTLSPCKRLITNGTLENEFFVIFAQPVLSRFKSEEEYARILAAPKKQP
jgi:hypothetical protein